jgi:hypothetical protein
MSRRGFVKSSLLVSAAIPLGIQAQTSPTPLPASAPAAVSLTPEEKMPTGKLGGQEFSRLFIGGNLIGGYSHSRDLNYVSTLMRRYNTPAKIRETLELAEAHGINAINTYVMQENQALFDHWKCGGKIKWFAQVRLDAEGGYSHVQKAVDEGATGIHITGDKAKSLLDRGEFEKVGEIVQLTKSKKCIAGVAAHELEVIVECEKAKLDVDFYQKTLHTLDYFSAPRPDDKERHDNCWCEDPQAVVDFMAKVQKPWIGFKVLAAGAIQPRAGFVHAFNSGVDFMLVGMFDWQVADDAKLAAHVYNVVSGPNSKRTRPWFG